MTVEAPPRPPQHRERDPEALIEEARQRARRRRLLYLAAVLVIVVAGAAVGGTYYLLRAESAESQAQEVDQQLPRSLKDTFFVLLSAKGPATAEISIMRANGTGMRRLARAWAEPPALSPQGSAIAYARTRDGLLAGTALFVLEMNSRRTRRITRRSEEHTSELQSRENLVCR